MKKAIHPKYYDDAAIVCACGHKATVGSTIKELRVELCSVCHPFYTGKQNMVDTARRIEKFAQRTGKKDTTAATQGSKKTKTVKRAAQKAEKKTKKTTASEA